MGEGSMAEVICNNCGYQFDPTDRRRTGSAAVAGAATGALLGARIGAAGGPWGILSGAVVGGLLAGAGASKMATCPCCNETFWF